MTLPSGDLLTISEVAEHLHTSRWSVARLVKAGELTTIPVFGRGRGGSKRISRANYLALLAAHTISVGEEQPVRDNQPADGLPTLHDFEDVAAAYGISLRRLREAANRGEFSYIPIGAKKFFTSAQLTAYLDARTKAAKEDPGLAAARAKRDRRKARASRVPAQRQAA